MRTETVTHYEVGDVVFVPRGATWSYGAKCDVAGRVAKVDGDVDGDGDIYVKSLTDATRDFVAESQVLPWDESDPDHDRVFLLDAVGLNALPVGARVSDKDGDEYSQPERPCWGGLYSPYELLNPECLDVPTFEFPLEIIDDTSAHGLPEGARVRVVCDHPYTDDERTYVLVSTGSTAKSDDDYSRGSTTYLGPDEVATAADAYAPLERVYTPPQVTKFQPGDRVRVLRASYAEETHGRVGTVTQAGVNWRSSRIDGAVLHPYLVRLDDADSQYSRSDLYVAELEHYSDELSDEVEGPVYVLDPEGFEALPVGSLIKFGWSVPLFKTYGGLVNTAGSSAMWTIRNWATDHPNDVAEVLYIHEV